jgi:hypothetical protein
MNRLLARKRHLVAYSFAIMTSLLALCSISSPVNAASLVNTSPTPELSSFFDMKDLNGNAVNRSDVVSHYIIKTNGVGNAPNNTFGVYFDSNPSALKINYWHGANETCGANDSSVVSVGISLGNSATNPDGTPNPSAIIRRPGWTVNGNSICNSTVHSYTIPSGSNAAFFDTNTNKYKVEFHIGINSGSVSYRLSAPAGAKIGSVRTSAINYGIQPDRGIYRARHTVGSGRDRKTHNERSEGYFAEASTTFGLPCSENFSTLQTIKVYDADNRAGLTKKVRFRIYENESVLPSSRYTESSNASLDNNGGVPYLQPLDSPAGTSQTSSVKIQMVKGAHYTIKIWNLWRAQPEGNGTYDVSDTGRNHINPDAGRRANNNFVSIGLPGDAIYGDTSFNCGYTLSPSINPINDYVDPGARMPVAGNVDKQGIPDSNPTAFHITELQFPNSVPLSAIDGQTLSANADPCAAADQVLTPAIRASRERCNDRWNYNGSRIFTGKPDNPVNEPYDVPNSPGKRICFIISVNSKKEDPAAGWAHSKMECFIIAKRPKVHILGSDLRVIGMTAADTGKISTSLSSNMNGNTFGSWAEYDAFSRRQNDEMASGAGLRGGNSPTINHNRLTFSNNTTTLGNYGVLAPVDTKAFFLGLTKTAGAPTSGDIGSGVYDLGAGNTSLGRIDLSESKSVVLIKNSGTLTIDQDITIPDSYTDARRISQVVIIAPNINIADGVRRVDAWLIATNDASTGTIGTCGTRRLDASLQLTVAECNQPLIVNGPVISDKLHLLRTAKADADSPGEAAEVFNLRPSSYIWAYNYANQTIRAQTTYLRELPPRY